MDEQQKAGKRLPAPGRPAAEASTTPQPQPVSRPAPAATAQPAPQARPAPRETYAGEVESAQDGYAVQRTRPLPGVPMTSIRPGTARPTAAPSPQRTAPAPGTDVGEASDVDLDVQFGDDLDTKRAPAPAGTARAAPRAVPQDSYEQVGREELEEVPEGTPSRVYSTRRALAEQINRDEEAKRAPDEGPKGIDGLKGRTEAWRKMVKDKELEGKSPYLIGVLKGSFFPLLYVLISVQLLRRYLFEYDQYYNFEPLYLLVGFVLGAITLLLIAAQGMLRARRMRSPVALGDRAVVVGVGLFVVVSVALAFLYGLAYAWQFSIGYFAAGLLTPLLGFAIERGSKGTFWVKEPTERDSSHKRFLEFIPTAGN